jgi:GTP cyclohydrolase I
MKHHLTWADVEERARDIAVGIEKQFRERRDVIAYPIPRGGIPAALAVQSQTSKTAHPYLLHITEDPYIADIFIDDIIDSGTTREKFLGIRPLPFFALVDKQEEGMDWWEFPWERMSGEQGPEENVRRLIEYIGDDPNREGLLETPSRVVRSYTELFGGYGINPSTVLKVFEDDSCDEMVIVRDIEFYSSCEHHMLPFFGKAHIAYIPDGRVVGVSKLVRLLEVFARRLQIQERLCEQVTGALDEHLKPKGSACVLEAKHLCMTGRGVSKQHSVMVTSSLTGAFREKGNPARIEFLSMIRNGVG